MSGDPFVASRPRRRARLWLAAQAALVAVAVVPSAVPTCLRCGGVSSFTYLPSRISSRAAVHNQRLVSIPS